jgi:hypothetical protein
LQTPAFVIVEEEEQDKSSQNSQLNGQLYNYPLDAGQGTVDLLQSVNPDYLAVLIAVQRNLGGAKVVETASVDEIM